MCSLCFIIIHQRNVGKSLVVHNTSSEQTTLLRSRLNSINCKNTVKQCEKLSYSYWFIDRDFDDLSNGDYSQQSIALIAIIFVSAITALLIPFAECVPRPSFFQIFDYFKWLFHLYVTNIQPCHTSLPVYPPKMIPGRNFGILASSTRIGGYSYIWSKHEMDVSI